MTSVAPAEPAVAPRRSKLRARLLALAISFFLMFVAGEIVVRATAGAPWPEREPLMAIRANEYRGWEMIPGDVHYTYQSAVHVNAMGLRGEELAPKAEGELRILALGDSLIYGQGVDDDQTLPAHLERVLEERDPSRPVTVVNAGHRAYATHQELGLLRELGAEIQPDEVIVFWYWNDVLERDLKQTFERLSARGPIVFDIGGPMEGTDKAKWYGIQLVRRSALVMWLYDVLPQLVRGSREAGFKPGELDAYAKRFQGYLDGFQELSGELGFRLRFAIIPDAVSLTGPHLSTEAEARVLEMLESAGIETIDLRTPLVAWVEANDTLPIIPFDWHYLPEGNRVLAEAVANTP